MAAAVRVAAAADHAGSGLGLVAAGSNIRTGMITGRLASVKLTVAKTQPSEPLDREDRTVQSVCVGVLEDLGYFMPAKWQALLHVGVHSSLEWSCISRRGVDGHVAPHVHCKLQLMQ